VLKAVLYYIVNFTVLCTFGHVNRKTNNETNYVALTLHVNQSFVAE